MGFDLFQSRRNHNEFCRWWTRNETDETEEDELVYKRVPSGSFWAEEIAAEVNNKNVLAGVFMTEKTSITIRSSDDLSSIKSKDIIEYEGSLWRVDDIQKRKARIQNTEFGNPDFISHYWYLSLIKG